MSMSEREPLIRSLTSVIQYYVFQAGLQTLHAASSLQVSPYSHLAKWNTYHLVVATDAKRGEKWGFIYVA